ncbi:MAG TPA: hypothetical protein VGE21_14635, partial [Flavobacteriales bacterium]
LYLDDALNAVTGDANDRVMPYPSGEYDVERTVSDPDGTYLMLVRKYPDAGDRKDLSNEERYRHPLVLLTFPPGSRNATVRELDLQDKFIGEMLFLQPENDDDAIVCAGFYGNKAEHGMRGTFFLRLDRRTKEVAHRSFRELETKLVGSPVAFGEKLTKRIEAEQDQRRFLPRNIVRRADGGAALVAEQAYDYRVTETFNGRTTSTRHYVRNNILVVCADVRSEIQWVTNIPKWQSVEHTDNYGSFALAQQGEALYFLFNDRDGNIPEPTDGVGVFNLIGDDNNVTLVTLDREGSMVRELFMGSEHKPFLLIPASCKPLDDGRFFISTKNLDREMRFGFVTFD